MLVSYLPLPSLRDTFPRKRGKGLFCAKRRKCWGRQAASLPGSPGGVNTGPAKRRKCWFLISPFRRFATPSPASGGRDYFVPSGVNAGPSSGINTGSSRRRKHWFRQSGVVDEACRHRDLSGALANASGFQSLRCDCLLFPICRLSKFISYISLWYRNST